MKLHIDKFYMWHLTILLLVQQLASMKTNFYSVNVPAAHKAI